jgi:hypothetical protein
MKLLVVISTLIGLLFTTGCSRIGSKLEDHIELVGTTLTETSVTIEEIDLKAARGAIAINEFRVANPDGYVAKNAMSCRRVYLNVGLMSTAVGEPLAVDRLVISYPVLNFEQKADGGSNLKDIADNVEKNMNQADQDSADYQPASPETPSEPLRIKIGELLIEGVTLNVLRADGTSASAVLPPIMLENVGGEIGVTPAQLGLVVAGAMTGEMLKEMIARELIERAGDIKQAMSAENLMAVLASTLDLSPELQQKIVPLVEELSRGLIMAIDAWVEQGFIDLSQLSTQLAPVLDMFEQEMAEYLDSEQFAILQSRVHEIKGNAVEVLRHLAVNQIAGYLEISPEQLVQLRPILHEHFVRISEVIRHVSENPERSKEMLVTAYEEAAMQLQTNLSSILTPVQMEQVSLWLDEALDKILVLVDNYLD